MICRVGDRVYALDLLGEPVEGDVIRRREPFEQQAGKPAPTTTLIIREDQTGRIVYAAEHNAIRRERPAAKPAYPRVRVGAR
jgi:hypothetical protein